jgi:8-oxo-dGTP pyrophosphatase MutT (NUDIX family)
MVKRSRASSFMGGVYVFPGGGVDAQDVGAELAGRASGWTDERASARLGIHSGGLALFVTAVRELFEESGMLLAERADGTSVALSGETGARIEAQRSAINRRELAFADLVAQEDLTLKLAGIEHVAHWITPESECKRFDTYFFVARAPEDQVPAHDAGETVAAEWITPAQALARHRAGEIEMVLPTIRNLRYIESFPVVEALVAAAAELGEIPTIMPRMILTPDGSTLLAPGDEGYEDGPPTEWDSSYFPAAMKRRAAQENPPDA